MVATEGSLFTQKQIVTVPKGEFICSNTSNDVLQIAVLKRYNQNCKPALAFVKGFGLTHGAIASSVAHDSHNIVAVGATAAELAHAINMVVAAKGGIAAATPHGNLVLPLPCAGIMTDMAPEQVAATYQELNAMVKACGCSMHAPFMTLSFMALLVIPSLKLSDLGLFDSDTFTFTPLFY
jgi:adenine deaminase